MATYERLLSIFGLRRLLILNLLMSAMGVAFSTATCMFFQTSSSIFKTHALCVIPSLDWTTMGRLRGSFIIYVRHGWRRRDRAGDHRCDLRCCDMRIVRAVSQRLSCHSSVVRDAPFHD